MEAHGASYNLMEAMGIKSDDIRGRKLAQLSIMFGKRQISLQNNRSESLNLLIQYLRGIGFDLEAFDHNDKEIDFYKYFVDK